MKWVDLLQGIENRVADYRIQVTKEARDKYTRAVIDKLYDKCQFDGPITITNIDSDTVARGSSDDPNCEFTIAIQAWSDSPKFTFRVAVTSVGPGIVTTKDHAGIFDHEASNADEGAEDFLKAIRAILEEVPGKPPTVWERLVADDPV